jgi:acyl-CoA hydrolase
MTKEPKYMTADEAVKFVKSGDHVFVQGSCSIPEALIAALAKRGNELSDVTLYNAFALARRVSPLCKPELKDAFHIDSFFVSNAVRGWVNEGYATTTPRFFGQVPILFRDGTIKLDIAFINCSLPDENGYVSLGVSADITPAAVECAKFIIAQINPRIPYTYGDALVHIDRIDAAVRVDQEPVALPTVEPNDDERKIGGYIAEQIPDGATLQIGVGGIPNAVLAALTNHKHLGLHTEALTDGVVPLINSGVIDNSQKVIEPGKTVCCLALGSRRLYDYMDYNKELLVKDVAWTNDPFRIRQNPKMMAINSALEIDLTGQVCADSIGTRIFSGVGGQHDFMYGGALSEGGKTFIAMSSITPKGMSKIKPVLTEGAGVVTTRFQTQYVVTEQGIAFLKGKNLAERARALINIAHPSVREELERAACERFGYSFLRLK